MNQDDLESLQGNMAALSSVIAQIIATLPAISAAQAALGLAIEQEEQNQIEASDGTPPAHTRGRNAIQSAFVDLLQAVSSRD